MGIAFDIGTTTLAARLAVKGAAKDAATEVAEPNPQKEFGTDVIARIEAAKNGNTEKMQAALLSAMNSMTKTLIKEAGAKAEEVKHITIAGNSVMEHIFFGVSPEPIGRPPYKAAFKEARGLRAAKSGLTFLPETMLYSFPLIGGFVGGDAVAAALSIGMEGKKQRTLLIDIGTNSEVLLSKDGVIYSTAAAAGPAFEAASIRHGMAAKKGAISSVETKGGSLKVSVIGSTAAKGICGSGLLDAVAALLRLGVIDKSGRIADAHEVETVISASIRKDNSANSVVLYKSASGEITLTQEDVRALQTAKAAIRASIEVLMEKAGLREEEIEKIFIAGAFGSSLKKESLEAIGLLPGSLAKKAMFLGDAALDGAAMALFSAAARKRAETIAATAKYVPLSGSMHFEKRFIAAMGF